MRFKNLIVFIILFFTIAICFGNSLNNDFLSDDLGGIVENKNIRQFPPTNVSLTSFFTTILYSLEYKIAGYSPFMFRLTDLLFHLGSSFLVFLLVKKFLNFQAAIFSAIIFAVHPLNVEAVTWISGGTYSRSAFFLFASLYLFRINSIWASITSLTAFFFALENSEKAVMFPLILVAFLYSFQKIARWKKTIPFFLLSGIWAIMLIARIGSRIKSLEEITYVPTKSLNHLIQIPTAIGTYFKLFFFPIGLTFYHSEFSFSFWQYFPFALIFLVFLGLLIYSFFKKKLVFFGLSFFIISLLPTLTPFGISWIVAERYVYFGSFGLILCLGYLFKQLLKHNRLKYLGITLAVIIVILLSIRTIIRNIDWKNQDNLWTATAKYSPSDPKTHNNMGDVHYRHRDYPLAIEEFSKAIMLNPNYADAYHNLGNTYLEMGQAENALKNYEKALAINPKLWQSNQNIAAIYFNLKNYQKAEEHLKSALKINNNDILYINLALIYLQENRFIEAKQEAENALAQNPENAAAKEILQNLRKK